MSRPFTDEDRDRLWEGCPQCGFFGDRRYAFVRKDFGEASFESSRIIQEQRRTIGELESRVLALVSENEALRLRQVAAPNPAPTFDMVTDSE